MPRPRDELPRCEDCDELRDRELDRPPLERVDEPRELELPREPVRELLVDPPREPR
ncbi:MAG TPA: hypothetical protein VFY71_14310 [Planctomycetota bacterium]|nr:hypothetical protein [Planctomycetota bacterium]